LLKIAHGSLGRVSKKKATFIVSMIFRETSRLIQLKLHHCRSVSKEKKTTALWETVQQQAFAAGVTEAFVVWDDQENSNTIRNIP